MVGDSSQPLTEMSTRNLPGGIGRLPLKADLTANCEREETWKPRRLTTVLDSTACYTAGFTSFQTLHV
jgi:hypothetical protein